MGNPKEILPEMPANTNHEVVERFQPRDGNMKVWRYMDLPKLVAFLETGSLHFARADTLGDPYEGSWTHLNMAAREHQIREMLADREKHHPDAKVKYTPEKLRQELKRETHLGRQTTYINCWHGGETESAAMWKLYGTVAGSIAIQSTYQKLVDALPNDVYMGMVQYKDYGSSEDWIPGGNIMYPLIHKRREFEYESEVRAFIWTINVLSEHRLKKRDDKPPGINVDIDIDKVVETIRVQPTTPGWARQAIEKLLKRYGWAIKAIPSQIDIEPIY